MNPFKKKTLLDSVQSMIDFFDGYEYGETVIVMTHGDYLHHKPEITVKNGMAYLGDIPIYQVGILNSGIVRLTTLQEAEKMLCCIE